MVALVIVALAGIDERSKYIRPLIMTGSDEWVHLSAIRYM
jgi:hypothetical protein